MERCTCTINIFDKCVVKSPTAYKCCVLVSLWERPSKGSTAFGPQPGHGVVSQNQRVPLVWRPLVIHAYKRWGYKTISAPTSIIGTPGCAFMADSGPLDKRGCQELCEGWWSGRGHGFSTAAVNPYGASSESLDDIRHHWVRGRGWTNIKVNLTLPGHSDYTTFQYVL